MPHDLSNINTCIYHKFFKFAHLELHIRTSYGTCIENMEKEKESAVLSSDCIRQIKTNQCKFWIHTSHLIVSQ